MATCPNRGALYSADGIEPARKIVSSPLGGLDCDLLYFMRDHCDSWELLEASRSSAATITVVRCKDQVVWCKNWHSTEAGEGKNNAALSTATSSGYCHYTHYHIGRRTTRRSITVILQRLSCLVSIQPHPKLARVSLPARVLNHDQYDRQLRPRSSAHDTIGTLCGPLSHLLERGLSNTFLSAPDDLRICNICL